MSAKKKLIIPKLISMLENLVQTLDEIYTVDPIEPSARTVLGSRSWQVKEDRGRFFPSTVPSNSVYLISDYYSTCDGESDVTWFAQTNMRAISHDP